MIKYIAFNALLAFPLLWAFLTCGGREEKTMNDRLLKESDVLKIAYQLPYVVNSAFFDAVKALPSADGPSAVDLSSVYSTAYRNGYEKGKADRKTENCSEIPSNCETCKHWEHGVHSHYYCARLAMRQDCKYEPKDEPQTERSSEK